MPITSPIFIVGPHRAGSTLWHNLIAMCPGVLRLPEARFMGPRRQKDFQYFLKTQVGDLSNDANVDKMVRLCFSQAGLPGLGGAMWRFEGLNVAKESSLHREVTLRIRKSERTLGAIVRIIIEELTRFAHCSRACVKFPVELRHTAELMRWFPEGKVVHITRDPRGLAMSKSNDPYGTGPMVIRHPYTSWLIRKAALSLVVAQYRFSARIHRTMDGLANYRLFRYEDLLAEPEKTLRELCRFVESDFAEDMLQPERGQHEHQASSLTGKQQKAFDAEAAVRWQKVISPIDNLLITSLTRSSMTRLGYDPDRHPIFQRPHALGEAGRAIA